MQQQRASWTELPLDRDEWRKAVENTWGPREHESSKCSYTPSLVSPLVLLIMSTFDVVTHTADALSRAGMRVAAENVRSERWARGLKMRRSDHSLVFKNKTLDELG